MEQQQEVQADMAQQPQPATGRGTRRTVHGAQQQPQGQQQKPSGGRRRADPAQPDQEPGAQRRKVD